MTTTQIAPQYRRGRVTLPAVSIIARVTAGGATPPLRAQTIISAITAERANPKQNNNNSHF